MGKLKINHLESEKSPHLRKHASDAVFWQPWSEKALNQAREQQRRILLSLDHANSYLSTIQDVNVFNNEHVAKILNDMFICIKVDADEHPHLAKLFSILGRQLTSVDLFLPINLILSPNWIPLYATGCLGNPREKTKAHFDGVETTSIFEIIEFCSTHLEERSKSFNLPTFSPKKVKQLKSLCKWDIFSAWFENLAEHDEVTALFDFQYIQVLLNFEIVDSKPMVACHKLNDSRNKTDYLYGGIWDSSNKDFSFICTNKSLSGNSEGLIAYTMATLIYSDIFNFKDVSTETAKFMINALQSPEGGFWNGIGGKRENGCWKYSQVLDYLGENRDTSLFCEYLKLPQDDSSVYLLQPVPLEVFARWKKEDPSHLKVKFEQFKKSLREQNDKKHELSIDKTIYTAENGKAIVALAQAGLAQNDKSYLRASVKAAGFIKDHLYRDNELFRRFVNGVAEHPALLEDYAQMIRGCLALFEADQGFNWLKWAIELTRVALSKFYDNNGSFHYKEILKDSALKFFNDYPAVSKNQFVFTGESIFLDCLKKLCFITEDDELTSGYKSISSQNKKTIDLARMSFEHTSINSNRHVFIVCLNEKENLKEKIASLLSQNVMPYHQIIWRRQNDPIPIFSNLKLENGKTTIHVFLNGLSIFSSANWEAIQQFVQSISFTKYPNYPEKIEKDNKKIEHTLLNLLEKNGDEWESEVQHAFYFLNDDLPIRSIYFKKHTQENAKTDHESCTVSLSSPIGAPFNTSKIYYSQNYVDSDGKTYYEFCHKQTTPFLSIEFHVFTYSPLTEEKKTIWKETFARTFVESVDLRDDLRISPNADQRMFGLEKVILTSEKMCPKLISQVEIVKIDKKNLFDLFNARHFKKEIGETLTQITMKRVFKISICSTIMNLLVAEEENELRELLTTLRQYLQILVNLERRAAFISDNTSSKQTDEVLKSIMIVKTELDDGVWPKFKKALRMAKNSPPDLSLLKQLFIEWNLLEAAKDSLCSMEKSPKEMKKIFSAQGYKKVLAFLKNMIS